MLKKCKYLFLWLIVWLFWFISFSYWYSNGGVTRISLWKKLNQTLTWWYCVVSDSSYSSCSSTYILTNSWYHYLWWIVFCNDNETRTIHNWWSSSCPLFIFDWSIFNSDCPDCPTCPEVDTWSILSWSCDINYCVENWLCPTSSWSRSELVINNIVHEWRPLINLNIPDYIQRDYTVDDNQYDVYVWSWYDQDYINSVLEINSYRPDSEDFTQIFVSWLTLIFPYIFVALLILFIWKLLKRVFK